MKALSCRAPALLPVAAAAELVAGPAQLPAAAAAAAAYRPAEPDGSAPIFTPTRA